MGGTASTRQPGANLVQRFVSGIGHSSMQQGVGAVDSRDKLSTGVGAHLRPSPPARDSIWDHVLPTGRHDL
jgi:hypothetical protein